MSPALSHASHPPPTCLPTSPVCQVYHFPAASQQRALALQAATGLPEGDALKARVLAALQMTAVPRGAEPHRMCR